MSRGPGYYKGMQVGPFTLIEIVRVDRSTSRTIPWWRVRCGHCGNDQYVVASSQIRKQKSCGCRRWTGDHRRGAIHTAETRAQMSASHVGIQTGEANSNWKGDAAGYQAFHAWARRKFEPIPCEHCGAERPRMEWAIRHDHPMTRNREDWLRLCVPCHRSYDGTTPPEQKRRNG